jgi:hypothetical protein
VGTGNTILEYFVGPTEVANETCRHYTGEQASERCNPACENEAFMRRHA